jgi:hypothetical protein
MIREIKRLIAIISILAILAIIILIFTVFWPAFVTTTTEHDYTHEAAVHVNITVICTTPDDCNIFINNSTGDRINVSIRTTAPLNAEYKGAQKVRGAFDNNVTFIKNNMTMDLDITITGASQILQLTPSKASIFVYLPAGTNYTLTKNGLIEKH